MQPSGNFFIITVSVFVNLAQVTGCDPQFLCALDDRHQLHPEAAAAFARLQKQATAAGFDLRPVSCFRSFERQLSIWNTKARGERPVLDSAGRALVRAAHSDWEWVQAILRWSALPGASRHHWGTDLDVYDAAAVADDFQVQLTPAEVDLDGPFAALHDWLDTQIKGQQAQGFFRPYAKDTGGVAPERWHLSYAPVARLCEGVLSEEALHQQLSRCENFLLWQTVSAHWTEIYQRFVLPPVAASEQESLA